MAACVDRNHASFSERFREPTSLELSSEITVTLEQTCGEKVAEESMQGTVWTAGEALALAMCDRQAWPAVDGGFWQSQRRVLEIGSGTGLCGIAAALLGAEDVLLTDLPPLLPLLRRNVEANGVARTTRVRTLDWREETPADWPASWHADVILGSDITPFVQDLGALVDRIEALATPETRVYIAHQDRGGDVQFVREAVADRFTCEEERILRGGTAGVPAIFFFALRRRPEDEVCRAASEDVGEGLSEAQLEAACRGDIRLLKQLYR
jgi:hypothetical protein